MRVKKEDNMKYSNDVAMAAKWQTKKSNYKDNR